MNIKLTKTSYIDYIQFNRLLQYKELTHAFILKNHNLGFRNYPDNNTVQLSKEKIFKQFNVNKEDLFYTNQKHTDNIVEIKHHEKEALENYVDGIITNQSNVATLLTFADCMPLLFYDPVKEVFGNIHSGWKGTVQRIGVKTVQKLIKDYDCNPKDIICCMGPCIQKDHFLVNDDVKIIYEKTFPNEIKKYNIIEETNLSNEKGKQYRIDNVLLYRVLLQQIGLQAQNIIDSEICTVCNKKIVHSRRAEGPTYQACGCLMFLKKKSDY